MLQPASYYLKLQKEAQKRLLERKKQAQNLLGLATVFTETEAAEHPHTNLLNIRLNTEEA